MIDQEKINEFYTDYYDIVSLSERQQGLLSLPYSGFTLAKKIKNDSKILDVGCGYNIFKLFFKNLTGIDPVTDNADVKVSIQDFITTDIYDVILCLGSIQHGNFDDIKLIVEKLTSLLKQNGKIYWRCRTDIPILSTKEREQLFFAWTPEMHKELCAEYGYTLTDIQEENIGEDKPRIYAEWTKN